MINNLRSIKEQLYEIVENNKFVKVPFNELKTKYGFYSIIRFRKEEFSLIKGSRLTHFNISYSDHRVDKMYALVSIEKGGFFDGEKEILPILNFDNYIYGKCVAVRNNVPYSGLKDDDFENSISSIKTVQQLQKAILKRYKNSMSHISDEEKLKLGVGITELEIIKHKKQ